MPVITSGGRRKGGDMRRLALILLLVSSPALAQQYHDIEAVEFLEFTAKRMGYATATDIHVWDAELALVVPSYNISEVRAVVDGLCGVSRVRGFTYDRSWSIVGFTPNGTGPAARCSLK
jgi:hypothetical protein